MHVGQCQPAINTCTKVGGGWRVKTKECVSETEKVYSEARRGRERQRDDILKELLSKLSNEGAWNLQKNPKETITDVLLHPWMNSLLGGLQTLSGLIPGKSLASLHQPIDQPCLSGFLYNISQYLQDMSTGQEEAPIDQDQLWEKVLYFFLQTEGNAAQSQWNGRVPPRPSIQVKDWFLSLRGSPHWDWLLGLLQSLTSLLEHQPHKSLLTLLSQNWRTVSAVLEASLQALISGTYGQASAGLQGFICALKGRTDCPFGVSWLQYVLRLLKTHNWSPMVSLHSAGEDTEHRRGSGGRIKPFSLPPEAMRQDLFPENTFVDDTKGTQNDPDSMRHLFLQALSRSTGDNLAQKNLALVQSLDGLRTGLLHRLGSSVYGNLRRKVSQVTTAMLDDVSNLVDVPQPNARGQCSVGNLRQLILWGIRHNVTWNTQALGVSTHGLPSMLPLLSCPSNDENSFRQKTANSTPKSSPSQKSNQKRHHVLPGTRHHHQPTQPQSRSEQRREIEYSSTAEILEAACNESIPGLTGVSNFTVFLYCKLFDGENGSVSPVVAEMGLDLHATCSDAAWYLSAAEEDFLWVHVCSEFFAHEFNNTVCSNSSFWLQRAHQAARTNNYNVFNQTNMLCLHLSSGATGSPELVEGCLAQLGSSRFMSAQTFRRCFLPNNSALISALCGREPLESHRSLPEGSWAAAYCFRQHNLSTVDTTEKTCQYEEWAVQTFLNVTMLEVCGKTHGLREYMCLNASLYRQLLELMPRLSEFCADLQGEVQDGKCLLQRFFNMLPAQYEFDTSQLCVDPAQLMLEVLHKLTVCQVEGGENQGFFVMLGYVLRVLDFMVGLSSGLDEGEKEARQGLGQAILLSSLLENGTWSTLRPEASTSVLHTVGVFLRREWNPNLKEDLLSCFSPVLWDLIQQDNNSSALRVLLQEYLKMPEDSIRTLVMSAEKDAVKRFLSHMHQSWDHIQVETSRASQKELQAMETMTAAFINKFPKVTPELFVDLSQFIPFMSVSDIMSFPASLMVNDSVLAAIRDHSSEMKSPQKKAFVKRLLQSVLGDVPTWPPYFLSSILPLLPYLPISRFQQLTSQQLTPLVELLGNSSLDGVRGRHVVRTIFTKNKNVTIDNIMRLGVLACYLDPLDLHSFLHDPAVSFTLQRQLLQCVSKGFIRASGRLSSWLIPAVQTLNASSMAPGDLTGLSALLPQLGASFLLSLPSQQLLELLSQPGIHRYSPAQAFGILSRISKDTNLTVETLCRLKPLHSGLSPAVLSGLDWSEVSESGHCQCWSNMLTELKPGHKALLYSAMQEALHRHSPNITQRVNCLLPLIPLRKLSEALQRQQLPKDISLYRDINWSPQQAQLLFKWMHDSKNITNKMSRELGHVGGGMTCNFLRLWHNDSDFAELLHFVTWLPGHLRPALRKCIIEELRKQPEVDVSPLSPWFSATLPLTMMDDLSNTSFRAVLDHVQAHFADFLLLPHYKQTNIAERAISELGSSTLIRGVIDGTTLDMLGPLLPFLERDTLALVDRGALALRLEEMRNYCLPKEALRDISMLLTQKDIIGEPSKWQVGDVEHLGRLLFSLSTKQINSIPLTVLNKDAVEQVLVGQERWEDSVLSGVCLRRCMDQHHQREKTLSLMRGILKAQGRDAKKSFTIPRCVDIKSTFPSAWTSAQLRRMSQVDMRECVEVFGQDASLSSEQRRALWVKLRQAFSPVSELRADEVLALGSLVTEMAVRELHDISLTDVGFWAHLGTLTHWSPRKMRAVILGMMRKRNLKIEHLSVIDLATFGHLICGLYPSEMTRLNPYNLSMAVRFLRELSLPCTEQQMEALTSRLSRAEAFGPVSAWGPEVFTEIGTLAAGLEDIVLSALTQEQVEGITTEAISLLSPKKMAVVFSAIRLSWLSAEQAWAITQEQWTELDDEQRHAVGLARYEGDVLLELRGRNSAAAALNTLSFLAPSLWLWHLF
ncbi:stereocilin [Dunckerocampus dactyliophorus]|uniref:stereocilin n=1 Tax=Dunckerocampus dactyliophorus TaxID=161453 RepID=UPI00240507A6|nr:stereocilin [Dunckerocampus dactyliophorus]